MISYYYINNDLKKAQSIHNDLNWLVIDHFNKLIDNDKD